MSVHLDPSNEEDFAFTWRNYLKDFDGFSCQRSQHVTLPSTIELFSLDMISLANATHIVSIEQAPIIFGFHISGRTRSTITHSATRKETVYTEANKVIIGYAPNFVCETMLMERQHYRFFNMYVPPWQLYSLLDGRLDIAPVEIKKMLEGSFHEPYAIVLSMSPQTRMIIDQIHNCSFQGGLKELYLEHKSMELILHQFYEIQCGNGYSKPSKLGPGDIDRIHEAKRILFKNIENPPTLIDLAQQVGINQTKLKKGFRQIFETTAYAMVRQERISRACELLDSGNLNVAEIGHQLGFSDTSHFIREFTRYYGVTPGKYSRASVS